MRRFIAVAAVSVLGAVLLTACGGSGGGGHDMSNGMQDGSGTMKDRPVVAGAREIPMTGDSFAFSPKTVEVAADEQVTIVLTSKDLDHDVYVDGVGHIVHAGAGTTEKGGLVIERPGTYKFWCTERGHKAGGMVGTITVTT